MSDPAYTLEWRKQHLAFVPADVWYLDLSIKGASFVLAEVLPCKDGYRFHTWDAWDLWSPTYDSIESAKSHVHDAFGKCPPYEILYILHKKQE